MKFRGLSLGRGVPRAAVQIPLFVIVFPTLVLSGVCTPQRAPLFCSSHTSPSAGLFRGASLSPHASSHESSLHSFSLFFPLVSLFSSRWSSSPVSVPRPHSSVSALNLATQFVEQPYRLCFSPGECPATLFTCLLLCLFFWLCMWRDLQSSMSPARSSSKTGFVPLFSGSLAASFLFLSFQLPFSSLLGATAVSPPFIQSVALSPSLHTRRSIAFASASPQLHSACEWRGASSRTGRPSSSSLVSPVQQACGSALASYTSPAGWSSASSRCHSASSSPLSFVTDQDGATRAPDEWAEEEHASLLEQLPKFSFDFFEETPEPPPLASHGPEDSPTIHVPGVWHFYLPRSMYTAGAAEEGSSATESEKRGTTSAGDEAENSGEAGKSGGKGRRRNKKMESTETEMPREKGGTTRGGKQHAYTSDPEGICGRKEDYDGPEAIYFFEDHTALIPSLSARGNWALVDPQKNSPLLNKEFRLCIFSAQSPHERLLLRGVFAFSPRPAISLWDERVQLHAAQISGSTFVRRDVKELASSAATVLPPNVELWDNAGNVVLGQEAETKKKEEDALEETVQFLSAGDFTAYRVLGEDENYFKVHHHFIRSGPRRLYHVLEPDAPELFPGATAPVETLLAPKSPVALYPSAAPVKQGGKRNHRKVMQPGDKGMTEDKQSEETKGEVRERLEALLHQFSQEPPEAVLWPVPRLPKRAALEEDEEDEEDD
ncbi:putative transmembrane protein [Toxoplasma gondii TgCatPRC2]|uniref:Putative transmembrane protein n=1 Tax=Toxoplasma gondii TgCatPRC2 TaxID=1130821 RepID=A0A151H716_TOXGO|nr:putative transmembrane protein [Toxoplasma gondii TgCatPRC2]